MKSKKPKCRYKIEKNGSITFSFNENLNKKQLKGYVNVDAMKLFSGLLFALSEHIPKDLK